MKVSPGKENMKTASKLSYMNIFNNQPKVYHDPILVEREVQHLSRGWHSSSRITRHVKPAHLRRWENPGPKVVAERCGNR